MWVDEIHTRCSGRYTVRQHYELFHLGCISVSTMWTPTGSLSLTLRHRLQCEIKTEHEVSTLSPDSECPISPTEEKEFAPKKLHTPFQKFVAKVELNMGEPRAKMLVRWFSFILFYNLIPLHFRTLLEPALYCSQLYGSTYHITTHATIHLKYNYIPYTHYP